MSSASLVRRIGFGAAGAALVLVGLAVPAQAESEPVSYSCTVEPLPTTERSASPLDSSREASGSPTTAATSSAPEVSAQAQAFGGMTAVFDTAMPEGETGLGIVDINPVTASVTLSAELVSAIRGYGVTSGKASAGMAGRPEDQIRPPETDLPFVEFDLGRVTLPTSGSWSFDAEGTYPGFEVSTLGPNYFYAGAFYLGIGNGTAIVQVACDPDDPQVVIDSVIGVADSSTSSPTTGTQTATRTSSSPARPVIVQTDAGDPTTSSALPFAVAGVGALVAAVALRGIRRRRGAHR